MESIKNGNTLTILYLQLDEKIDRDFIFLASRFRGDDVTLVPVRPQEIDYFLTSKMIPVILLTKNMDQLQKFTRVKKRYIDYFLKTRRIRLIHLNSFSEIKDYISLKPKRIYINLKLPLTMAQAKEQIVLNAGIESIVETSWPGGKRAKLPTDVSNR
ncbi:MAG: hypothetical protein NXH75_05770 [Halobacteriovoraceae bacterium]|jgi:hypothetical protein|nr:hypothetical protein [Halobacteriovoraceae bacterium]